MPALLLAAIAVLAALTDRSLLATAAPLGRGAAPGQLAPRCAGEDIGVRAYLAQTVFEGKARSRSPVRDGVYNVTFVVQNVFKGSEPGFRGSQVRLRFAEKPSCAPEGSKKPGIRRRGKYIVFADKIEQHIFKARGEPVKRSEEVVRAVKDILCHKCVRPPSVSGLEDKSLKPTEKMKQVCKVKGNPFPSVYWYKDGVRIQSSKKTKIRTNKKRSTLVIPRIRPEDAGLYKCQAKSVTGEEASMSSRVTVIPDTTPENTTIWPWPCPVEHFCLNGGTCWFYETLGELVCQCADGYKGQRCENKDVYNRGSMYRPKYCNVGGFLSSFYC